MNYYYLRIIKIVVWIPVLVTGILITGFSSQNGSESSGLSKKAANAVIQVFDTVNVVSFTDENQREELIKKMQYPIRKGAHMTEYAAFTVFTYIALMVNGIPAEKRKYVAFIIAFLLACSDELHQRFVPGRSGRVTDVLIDSAGCIIALLIIEVIRRIYKKHIA